jgi:small subunit ribosomal protein S8
MADNISEMLTQIRNAQKAGLLEVCMRVSKLKLAIAKILEKEGFIESFLQEKRGDHDFVKIYLKYFRISNTKNNPAIKEIKKISKQGQRIYLRNKDIKDVKNKYGIVIISTSKGVMTGTEAKKSGLGGECLCEVW